MTSGNAMTGSAPFTFLPVVFTLCLTILGVRPAVAQTPPIQQPDSVISDPLLRTTEETAVEIDVWGGVVGGANDSISIAITIQPSHGSLQSPEYEPWTYTPNPGFRGTDTLAYVVASGDTSPDTTTVVVRVEPLMVANADTDTTYRAEADTTEGDSTSTLSEGDTTGTTQEAGTTESAEQPLAEVNPSESDTLSADTTQTDTTQTKATVTAVEADTSETESPQDTTATAGADASRADTARTGTLRAPRAAPDTIKYTYETREGDPLHVSKEEGLRSNDRIARLDTLSVSNPEHGKLMARQDGAFVYVPDSSFVGTDHFVVAAIDTVGTTRMASVFITVYPARPWWLYGIIAVVLLVGGGSLIVHLSRPSSSESRNQHSAVEKRVRLQLGYAQHIGARDYQEDALDFTDPNTEETLGRAGMLAIVADGMGGLERGHEASQTAVRSFRIGYEAKALQEDIPRALRRALVEANRSVCALSPSANGRVGSTLVAVVVHDEELYWIAVGDSRIYLLRNGQLAQLNEDHIYARDLAKAVARCRVGATEVSKDPERHALTSYVGSDLKAVDQNVRPFALQPDDRLLLCSDGLYDNLPDALMADILQDNDPQAACDRLVHEVLAADRVHQDNLTAVVLTYQHNSP